MVFRISFLPCVQAEICVFEVAYMNAASWIFFHLRSFLFGRTTLLLFILDSWTLKT